MCFIPGFVSQISLIELLMHFLTLHQKKYSREHYGTIVKHFDTSVSTVHPTGNYLCFNTNLWDYLLWWLSSSGCTICALSRFFKISMFCQNYHLGYSCFIQLFFLITFVLKWSIPSLRLKLGGAMDRMVNRNSLIKILMFG